MSEPKKPHRAIEMRITVSGDTWRDAKAALEALAGAVAEYDDPIPGSAMGGYSCGYSLDVTHDPEQTHDRWAAELDAYLDHKREVKT